MKHMQHESEAEIKGVSGDFGERKLKSFQKKPSEKSCHSVLV